ncbi:MAG: hypothetical protein ABI759_15675 [Candidatus Solibacter sp.]
MNGKFAIHLCLLGGVLLTSGATTARADAWNKKTYITTPRSIEVPGAVLPPGKYVFKLLDSSSNRHIVQIMNERENHVYATNLAIPKQRMEPADKTVLTFYETRGGVPEPVRAWFYPGDTIGQEFAYPRHRALEITRMTREDVPILAESRAPEMERPIVEPMASVETPTPAPVSDDANSADRTVAAAESLEPATVAASAEAEASMPTTDEDQNAQSPASTAPEPAMPHTAGNLAGIALAGLSCLGIAASLRKTARVAGDQS